MRECLGCETYAKYTHTRARRVRILCSRPSTGPSASSSPCPTPCLSSVEYAASRSSRAAPGFLSTCAFLVSLPVHARSFIRAPRILRALGRNAVVPGGIHDEHVADVAHVGNVRPPFRRASPEPSRRGFIVHSRRLTGEPSAVGLLYGLRLFRSLDGGDDEIILAHFRLISLGDKKVGGCEESRLSYAARCLDLSDRAAVLQKKISEIIIGKLYSGKKVSIIVFHGNRERCSYAN